ncbi:MAG: adenosine deaminase [Arenicella sp.]|jgi:adenosine deaminase
MRQYLVGCAVLILLISSHLNASERSTSKVFEKIKNDPVLLRQFLYRFPKGGDIHSHIDGAVYAENMIKWAAADGRCVNLDSMQFSLAPCDPENQRPAVSSVINDGDTFGRIVDAFSTRNYQLANRSGADQFFSTFSKFYIATIGREGHMLDEVTRRAASQNTHYLELMQSWNMGDARASAQQLDQQQRLIGEATIKTSAQIDDIEARRRDLQSCGQTNEEQACRVQVRYLAQILRTFPRDQVRAQTKLAVNLMQTDPRVVGLNFVAPEHHPISLRDYSWQMKMIAEETAKLAEDKRNISLHAGELALGLVPPEELGFHIRQAIEVAGAKRIGHAVDIAHDPNANQLLKKMANDGVAVEINLTSNDVILGVSGDQHPFRLFRQFGVPLTLSTDDEGVSRIDLTHEYQRAVESYDLNYKDIKQLARNALEYSFIEGESLFVSSKVSQIRPECGRHPNNNPTLECLGFLQANAKAAIQWHMELKMLNFEQQ